ncbi:MAG: aminotransferase class I/II-fold pyridoxal phosphate-dependent enzyme, partial [Flavobacteriaceae bacterium]
NPSGTIYTEEEYRALGKVLEKYPEVFILSDEIYEHINYGTPHFSIARIPELYDRTITVNGVAKAFAMTGWRIGYIGAPEWIAKACNKMQGQITSGANCIAQRATIAALEAPVSKIQYMIDEFAKRRELIIDLLTAIPGIKTNQPQGAFYVFADVSSYFGKTLKGKTIANASDFALYLLEEAHVATVTGDAFGNGNCIRISYAASKEHILTAIERIANALK